MSAGLRELHVLFDFRWGEEEARDSLVELALNRREVMTNVVPGCLRLPLFGFLQEGDAPGEVLGDGLKGYRQLADREGKDSLEDRKSTRLNSSHSQISYAVFCLKKKI